MPYTGRRTTVARRFVGGACAWHASQGRGANKFLLLNILLGWGRREARQGTLRKDRLKIELMLRSTLPSKTVLQCPPGNMLGLAGYTIEPARDQRK